MGLRTSMHWLGYLSASLLLAGCGGGEEPPATQLRVVRQPNEAISGQVMGTQPIIEVQDAQGKRATSATGTITARVESGSGTLAGSSTASLDKGVATFSALRIDGAGAHRLIFEASGLTSVSSAPLVVTQVPASLRIDAQPDTTYSGRYAQWRLSVLDHAGLSIPTAALAVNAEVASGSVRLIGAATTQSSGGLARFSATGLVGQGSYTLRFFAAGLSPVLSRPIVSTAPPPLRALDIGVGAGHICALSVTRQVYCWGANQFGQVGSPSGVFGAIMPQRVPFSGDVQALAVGMNHSCAIDDQRSVWCWGSRERGVLGFMPASDALSPTRAPLNERYTAISSKLETTCVLAESKRATCWGLNINGNLGAGHLDSIIGPVAVTGGIRFDTLTTGPTGSCGRAEDGSSYCWGATSRPGADSAIVTESTVPRQMVGPGFRDLVAGLAYGCARSTAERWWCWGANYDGRYGTGNGVEYATPTALPVLDGFRQLFPSTLHSCALTTSGEAFCWGTNLFGALGDGTVTDRFSPVRVQGGLRFTRLAAAAGRTCGITTAQTVSCWGGAPLGDSTMNGSLTPVAVTPP